MVSSKRRAAYSGYPLFSSFVPLSRELWALSWIDAFYDFYDFNGFNDFYGFNGFNDLNDFNDFNVFYDLNDFNAIYENQ